MKLKDIINELEKDYPMSLKEEWDNVGLLVGDGKSEINKIMITLDVTADAIEFAVKNSVDLIISHHPLIFGGIKQINTKTILGKKLIKLIENQIALYSMHTNIDAAKGGLNDFILKKLEVEESEILVGEYKDIYKLSVYVPNDAYKKIKAELDKMISFQSEKYEKVSYVFEADEYYSVKGSGTPYKESEGRGDAVRRIDKLIFKEEINSALSMIRRAHPYEEPAYEIIKLENSYLNSGIGRTYKIEESKISDYAQFIKNKLGLKYIRGVFSEDKKIKKVALLNGSGASFIRKLRSNIDLFITGDVKYHEALDAKESGLALMDIGHYEAEVFFIDLIKEKIEKLNIEAVEFRGEEVFKLI